MDLFDSLQIMSLCIQQRHLEENSITWDETSTIAETIPLFVVHPHEHQQPSKLAGNFIASVKSIPCPFCIKQFALSPAYSVFSKQNSMLCFQGNSYAPTSEMGGTWSKIYNSDKPVCLLPIKREAKTPFVSSLH